MPQITPMLRQSHQPLLLAHSHTWASCQIRKIAGCACAGNAGNVFPRHRGSSDPDMHHGTCVTHVPWCMPGSLTSIFLWSQWRGKHSRHSRRMRKPQFYESVKRPMQTHMSNEYIKRLTELRWTNNDCKLENYHVLLFSNIYRRYEIKQIQLFCGAALYIFKKEIIQEHEKLQTTQSTLTWI